MTPTTTVTITGVTPKQYEAITQLLAGGTTKKTKPSKTVDDEEDEDFGKKTMDADDLDEEEDTDTDEDGDDEEGEVDFATVRKVAKQYGESHPDQMQAILSSFNIKGLKELSSEKNERYWGPVYTKVTTRLAALKKKKK